MAAALGPLPLGGTPDGKAWCRKALHPADHEISSARFPGGSKVPTVATTFTQVTTLKPDPDYDGHVTSWEAHLYMRQDPVAPVSLRIKTYRDTGTSSEIRVPWVNRTVQPTGLVANSGYMRYNTKDLTAAYDAFLKGKNFYRITHMGLTIEHVCSTTTNQGTIISAQYASEPVVRPLAGYPGSVPVQSATGTSYQVLGEPTSVSGRYPVSPPSSKAFSLYQGMNTRHYLEGSMNQEMLLQATNGFTGPANQGLYIPLKLDHPDRFVNVDKKYVLLGKDEATAHSKTVYALRQSSIDSNMGWPFYATYAADSDGYPVLLTGCKECGSTISDTLIQGLDPHATLRLYLRVGIEYVPEITDPTACFARMSPLPDELAVRMYQELTCRLKDAYPMDYNDKSRLLEVINQYAKKLVPAIDKGLNFFAGLPGNPWAGVAGGLRTLTSAYLAPSNAKSKARKSIRENNRTQATPSAAPQGKTVTVDLGGGVKGKLTIVRPNRKK